MKQKIFTYLSVSFALLACCCIPAFAGYSSYGIPDSAEIRDELVSSWFTAPLAEIRTKESKVFDDGAGNLFKVSVAEEGSFTKVIVASRSFVSVDFINGSSKTTQNTAVYKETSPGSWVLYRDAKNGKSVKIRWYFNADSEVYLELRNETNKVYADLVAFGCYLSRSVPLGMSFRKLYSISFDKIQLHTKRSVPWGNVLVASGQYHSVLQMAAVIRQYLRNMVYVEDAAYNEHGELYSIEKNEPFTVTDAQIERKPALAAVRQAVASDNCLVLSSPGFIKWIADGIIEPITGRSTSLAAMVNPTVYYNNLGKKGVASQNWNISFTIDWCRNLAVEVLNSRSTGRKYKYTIGENDVTGVDVTKAPFVYDIDGSKLVGSMGYIKDSGYLPAELKSLLYTLAVTEPRYFYFAAIKQRSPLNASDTVFNNCAALFPYFDDNGKFDCIVFEMGKEMSLSVFLERHKDSFIHLERVKSTDYFKPLVK